MPLDSCLDTPLIQFGILEPGMFGISAAGTCILESHGATLQLCGVLAAVTGFFYDAIVQAAERKNTQKWSDITLAQL